MSIEKFKTLPPEALAAGYDVLFSGSHHFSRSVCYKACKVMDILNGDVTPGVQAEKWHEFFQVLEASQTGPPISSPEEWLKKHVSPHMRKCMEQGLEPVLSHQDVYLALAAYADHVAALVHRNTRHRAIEILNEEVADYVENEDQMGTIIGDKAGHRIMNIPLRAVYPAPAEGATGNNDKQGACLHEWIHNPHRGTKYCRKGCDGFITHPAGEENREGYGY